MTEAAEDHITKMDIPGSLPLEIFHEIWMYLSPRDLHNARNCCKKWRNYMQSFWKKKCMIEGYYECEDDLNSEVYRKFVNKFSRWEAIYLYNTKLEDNWIKQNYKEIAINMNDNKRTFIIKYFCGDIIIGTSGLNEIYVINVGTGLVEKRFFLNFPKNTSIKNIYAVAKIENQLIVVLGTLTHKEFCFTQSEVISIIVWNIETEKLLLHLQTKTISYLIENVLIYKDLVMFLTNAYMVHIFNIKEEKFEYGRFCVSCVCLHNDKIAMGTQIGTIEVMNLDYTELMTLNCCESNRTIIEIQIKGNYLISLSSSNSSKIHGLRTCIWNIERRTKLYQIENVLPNYLAIYPYEKKLCYVCIEFEYESRTFKLCDLDTGVCILELASGYVCSNNSFVIQRDTPNANLLKMWMIKTGKLIADLELPLPFPGQFFNNYIRSRKTKSKFLYFEYDTAAKFSVPYLKIIDFEAKIEI